MQKQNNELCNQQITRLTATIYITLNIISFLAHAYTVLKQSEAKYNATCQLFSDYMLGRFLVCSLITLCTLLVALSIWKVKPRISRSFQIVICLCITIYQIFFLCTDTVTLLKYEQGGYCRHDQEHINWNTVSLLLNIIVGTTNFSLVIYLFALLIFCAVPSMNH